VLVERDVGVLVRDGVRLSVDVYWPSRPGRFPALLGAHPLPQGRSARAAGLRCEEAHRYSTSAIDDDPLSARAEGRTRFRVRTPEHDVETRASGRFRATTTEFVVDLALDVHRDGIRLHPGAGASGSRATARRPG
jgi:hypothetical protein